MYINETAVGFPNNTVAEARQFGEVMPGRTNTGYGLSPETKKELEGILVETTKGLQESLFAKIRPKEKPPRVTNKRQYYPFTDKLSPTDATNASLADQKRQQMMTLVLGGIGILAIIYAAKKG